jgi:uncharacterized protein (DUF1786 family)
VRPIRGYHCAGDAAVMTETAGQLAWRGRVERALRIVAPALALVLVAADRVSRVVDREAPAPALPGRPMGPLPAQRRVGPGPADPGRE